MFLVARKISSTAPLLLLDEGFIDEGFIDEGFIRSDEGFIDEGFIDEGFIDEGFIMKVSSGQTFIMKVLDFSPNSIEAQSCPGI